MKIAIMQPYFFPYIGYFQLINAVDEFVIYNNIQFTKKGWINRNRILVNGKDSFITLPLKKDSDFLDVEQRFLSDSWKIERDNLLNRIAEAYRKAPYFKETFEIIEKCILFDERNLFKFILNSIETLMNFLDIKTKLVISSSIQIDHNLKSAEKVIAICNERDAKIYINPIGGTELYNHEYFNENEIELLFLKSNYFEYSQFNNEFIPWLSIIDIIMHNNKKLVQGFLKEYKLFNH